MNDNKSRDIFYGVVAIATLIVALIGATLAYFSITANSAEGAVSAKAAVVSINYEDGQAKVSSAEKLIPVTFANLMTLYRKNLSDLNNDYDSENPIPADERTFRCQDDDQDHRQKEYEVCSSFRFTVSNDVETYIRAILRTEFNGFKYLDYAVRKADCTDSTEANCWIDLGYDDNNNPVKFLHLDTCDNAGETKCYTGESSNKTYNALATKPVFGYTSSSDLTFKDERIAASEHTYDIVLFINDDDTNQNDDQGKEYRGNVYIETTSGTEKITGKVN